MSSEWLKKEIEAYFASLYEDRARSIEASKNLVSFVTGRSWVMFDAGLGIYKFTHRTFLEYFYARSIDERYDTVSQVVKHVLPHVSRSEWEVVSHLCLQLKTFRNTRRMSEALAELSERCQIKVATSKSKIAQLGFCAKALHYLAGPEAEVRFFVGRLYEAVFVIMEKNFFEGGQIISDMLKCLSERRGVVVDSVMRLLMRDIIECHPTRMSLAVSIVDQGTYGFRGPWGPGRRWVNRSLRDQILEGVKDQIFLSASKNLFAARLKWEWYDLYDNEDFRNYGLALVLADDHHEAQARGVGMLLTILSGPPHSENLANGIGPWIVDLVFQRRPPIKIDISKVAVDRIAPSNVVGNRMSSAIKKDSSRARVVFACGLLLHEFEEISRCSHVSRSLSPLARKLSPLLEKGKILAAADCEVIKAWINGEISFLSGSQK